MGNVGGLQALVGHQTQRRQQQAAGHWIEFSTTNAAFSQVVAGVRSHDVANELELKGPLTLGHATTLDGIAVDAIDGHPELCQEDGRASCSTSGPMAATCRSRRTQLDAKGKTHGTLHVAYSHWGETVRPEAPQGAVPIGPVSAV